ncbi:helix-turn-helix domain-containing protein [Streptomyces sp. Tu 2975]|uniref:helix-turn-helix domain-containing protein n=1 Tax=Streptomyces sp. Tu 2975 TaxID=2676871 RepID=UPI0032674FF7
MSEVVVMARQERAVRTRRAILVAAAEVFDEVGYEAATISEILKRSGLTKGALYFHFASKEELAQGVLAEQVHALPDLPEGELMLQTAVDGRCCWRICCAGTPGTRSCGAVCA